MKGSPTRERERAATATPIGPDEAKAIALKHLALVEDKAKQDIEVKRVDKDWVVIVEYLPPTYGGHVYVLVSADGKVRRIIPGR